MTTKLDKIRKEVYTLQHGESVVKNRTQSHTFFYSFSNKLALWRRKEGIMPNKFARGAAALLTLVLSLFLVACGGGGGSDNSSLSGSPTVTIAPAPTGPTVRALAVSVASATISIGSFSATNAVAVPVKPDFTGSVNLTGGTGEGSPLVAVRVDTTNCPGSQSFDAVVTMTGSAGTFKATPPQAFGNSQTCLFTLTPSVNGVVGASVTGTFTTEGVAKVAHYSEVVLSVHMDACSVISMFKKNAAGDAYTEVKLVNKSVYQTGTGCILALASVVYQGGVPYKTADGSLVGYYATPSDGNGLGRHYLAINPETAEIGKELASSDIPTDAVLLSTGYGTYGDTPYYSQGVGAKGRYAVTSLGVLYVTDLDSVNVRFAPNGDFTKSVVIGTEGYKHFTPAVSN